jgi:hypothetical protein
MRKPPLASLWKAFPDHVRYPTLKDLYTSLGGNASRNIHAPGFGPTGNTCASRLSIAFNKGGYPISGSDARAARATTLSTADGSRIIFRVSEFRSFLIHVLGKPTIDVSSPFDSSFTGKRGIVAFTVNWANATGHIALFDRTLYREPTHDGYATFASGTVKTSRGEFWELS